MGFEVSHENIPFPLWSVGVIIELTTIYFHSIPKLKNLHQVLSLFLLIFKHRTIPAFERLSSKRGVKLINENEILIRRETVN